jgi:ABC-type antimicrobial peptide transport system permease subunit
MTATMMVLRTTASLELVTSIRAPTCRPWTLPSGHAVAPFRRCSASARAPRFNAFLLGIFGCASLLLSTVGLYAVIAAHVRQRDREIAIRRALGATSMRIRSLVLTEAVRLAGAGAIVGVAGALAASPLIRSLLFGVDPLDPLTLSGAALLLVAAAALASYLPLRRAVRVDPVAILRGQ